MEFYIDINKSVEWAEHKHPRGKGGKFAKVAESSVVQEPTPKLKATKVVTVTATEATKLLVAGKIPVKYREALLGTLKHTKTENFFASAHRQDDMGGGGGRTVVGRVFNKADVTKAIKGFATSGLASKVDAEHIAQGKEQLAQIKKDPYSVKVVDLRNGKKAIHDMNGNVLDKHGLTTDAIIALQKRSKQKPPSDWLSATDILNNLKVEAEKKANAKPKKSKEKAEFDPFEALMAGLPKPKSPAKAKNTKSIPVSPSIPSKANAKQLATNAKIKAGIDDILATSNNNPKKAKVDVPKEMAKRRKEVDAILAKPNPKPKPVTDVPKEMAKRRKEADEMFGLPPVKKPRAKPITAVEKPKHNEDPEKLVSDANDHTRIGVQATHMGSYSVFSRKINGTEDIASMFSDLTDSDRERVYVVAMKGDTIIGTQCVHIGAVSASVADPKAILRLPSLMGADGYYVLHNHPSGLPTPSKADGDMTAKLAKAGDTLGMAYKGHCVIGDGVYSSLDREGSTMYNSPLGGSQHTIAVSPSKKESVPVYDTSQTRDRSKTAIAVRGASAVSAYARDNLALNEKGSAVYLIGTDTQLNVACAIPLDTKQDSEAIKRLIATSLVHSNANGFCIACGEDVSPGRMRTMGIKTAMNDFSIPFHDLIYMSSQNSRGYHSVNETGGMDMVKSFYIDLEKSITRAEAKAVHKELPPGGKWCTLRGGHHVYILNGKILAGAFQGTKGARKSTKAHIAEHQATLDEATAKAEAKAKATAKAERAKKRADAKLVKVVEPEKGKSGRAKITNPKAEVLKSPIVEAKPKKAVSKEAKVVAKPKKVVETPVVKKPRAKKAEPEVAIIRTAKQKNNTLAYDVGKKIGGARKDMAELEKEFKESTNGKNLAQIEAMNPVVAQQLVTKDKFFPKIDKAFYEKEKAKGNDVLTAQLKALAIGRVAPKPAGNTAQDRADYVEACNRLNNLLDGCNSLEDFRDMRSKVQGFIQDAKQAVYYKERCLTTSNRLMADPVHKARLEGEYASYLQKVKDNKAECDITPLGAKAISLFSDYDSFNNSVKNLTKGGGFSRKVTGWDEHLATFDKKDATPRERSDKKFWERSALSTTSRVGGRATNVEKPEDMIKEFGLRGVEFGNWVDDSSGKYHMTKCAEALKDLADMVGATDHQISFNGRLGLAFGARGHSIASAHYEPASQVINLTKMKGNGTLSHEWFHALDHALFKYSQGVTGKKTSDNIAGFASEDLNSKGDNVGTSDLPPDVHVAYAELHQAINKGEGVNPFTFSENKEPSSYYRNANTLLAEHGGDPHKALSAFQAKEQGRATADSVFQRYGYSPERITKHKAKEARDLKSNIKIMAFSLKKAYEAQTGKTLDAINVPTGMSTFKSDAIARDAGKSKKYWSEGCELSARAFEAYTQDKLASKKRKNSYLVHGTENDKPAGEPTSVSDAPYPAGEERKRINSAFDKLFMALAKHGTLKKALEFDLIKSLEHTSEAQKRNAYALDWASFDKPIDKIYYIPINRINTPYQTEEATNWDKVSENSMKMRNGVGLAPVVIGYDYDLHDGHHRVLASEAVGYTHVPCIVGGADPLLVCQAEENYGGIWK